MSDTYNSNIKPEEIQDKIMYKLAEFGYGAEDDPMLAEFVAVMVANKKSLEQVNSEMTDLIGPDYNPAFGDWLMQFTNPTNPTSGPETKKPEDTPTESMAVDDNSTSNNTSTRLQDPPQKNRLLMNALSSVNKTEAESKREKRRQDDMDIEESQANSQKQRRTNPGRDKPLRGKRGKLNHGDRERAHQKSAETVFTISLEPKRHNKMTDVSPDIIKELPQRCTFWPNCTKGEDCKFFHPTKPCRDYPNCPNGSKCMFIHLDDEKAEPNKKIVACKFGAKCTNPDCKFSHPSPAAIATTAKSEKAERCRYYPNCKNIHCTYSHVDEPQPNYGESLAPDSAPPSNPLPTKKIPVQCRDGSNCTRPGCHFLHPGETAPEQPSNKVPIQCRDGADCKRPGCHFLHPGEEMSSNAIPCRFGVYCKRPDCKFSHPHRQAGSHISERPFSVDNDNVVEKLPVINGNLTGNTSMGINDTPNPGANDDENVDVIMDL